MKKFALVLTVILVIAVVFVGVVYVRDRAARMDALEAGGTRIETRLGTVEYLMTGPPSGPVLAFVHGTPGGYEQGPPPRRGTRVLTMSRPGYLGTPLSSGATPEAQADLLAALLDALEIDRVAVMGASGGGPAAYQFALKHPERTIGLIAMEAISRSFPPDPEAPILPDSDLLLWLMLTGLETTQGAAGSVRAIMAEDPDLERVLADPDVTREVAGVIWAVWPPSRRLPGMNNDLAQFERVAIDLASIRVPTLIVHGTLDGSVPFAHAEHAAAAIPGARLHAIEGAGHLMPFAYAEEVDRVVAEFMAPFAIAGAD